MPAETGGGDEWIGTGPWPASYLNGSVLVDSVGNVYWCFGFYGGAEPAIMSGTFLGTVADFGGATPVAVADPFQFRRGDLSTFWRAYAPALTPAVNFHAGYWLAPGYQTSIPIMDWTDKAGIGTISAMPMTLTTPPWPIAVRCLGRNWATGGFNSQDLVLGYDHGDFVFTKFDWMSIKTVFAAWVNPWVGTPHPNAYDLPLGRRRMLAFLHEPGTEQGAYNDALVGTVAAVDIADAGHTYASVSFFHATGESYLDISSPKPQVFLKAGAIPWADDTWWRGAALVNGVLSYADPVIWS